MVVYPDCVTLGLVKDVNLFLIGDEHLLWGGGEGRGSRHVSTRVRTIIADTRVSPTSTIEPGFCAAAAEASPRASKERLEYMAWYSKARY
jgi:hypothetical protein